MPTYLDRETYQGFLADSLDQQAKLTIEDINSPRPRTVTPPPLPDLSGPADEPLAINRLPEPAPEPEPPPRPGVPDFDSLLASAGIVQAAAPPSPSPPPVPTTAPRAGAPPDFNSFLQGAGIDPGQGMSNVGTAVRGAVDNARLPSIDEFMQSAGIQPAQPQQTQQPALSHAEEPATATDMVDVGGKWKTQFDFGSTYTGNYRTGTPHRGIDLVPSGGSGIGTSVEAFTPGTVTQISRDSGAGGLMVYVQDDQGLTHTYMHLAGTTPGLAVGQKIARGQPIAQMGESGTEGSPHLHYEVRKNAASGDPLNQLIDPRPYMTGGKATAAQQAAAQTTAPTVGGTAMNMPSTTVPTTAGISGGGERSGRFGERGQWIMSEGARATEWLGADAQRALQAILVTEGGLDNARGDHGQSAGPLQFFAGGGQMNNLARLLRVPEAQAMEWVERHPVEAIQWAIGTPDKPGYLGLALAKGLEQGLRGADLATHAQRTGQVSVSPERAGANYNALFGNGGQLVTGAAAPPGTGIAQRGAELADQGAALTAGLQPGAAPESPLAAQQRRITSELQTIDRERQAAVGRRAAFEQQSQQAAEQPLSELRRQFMEPEPVQQAAAVDQPKPLWQQIGDTIGGSIAQGLQPIVEMFQGRQPIDQEMLQRALPGGVAPAPGEALGQAQAAAQWADLKPPSETVMRQFGGEEVPLGPLPASLPGPIGAPFGALGEQHVGPGVYTGREVAGLEQLRTTSPEYGALYDEQQRLTNLGIERARATGGEGLTEAEGDRMFEITERMSQIAQGFNLQEEAKKNPNLEKYQTGGEIAQSAVSMALLPGSVGWRSGRSLAGAAASIAADPIGLPFVAGTEGIEAGIRAGTRALGRGVEPAARAVEDAFSWRNLPERPVEEGVPIRYGDNGLPMMPPGVRLAADVASATAGGATGYATTPEDASPLERGARTAGGAILGTTGQRLATSPAARQRARQFLAEEEGALNLPGGRAPTAAAEGAADTTWYGDRVLGDTEIDDLATRAGFVETAPATFAQAIARAAAKADPENPGKLVGDSLSTYRPEEYAQMRTFLAQDGTWGYALKPADDGAWELVSVFKDPDAPRGAGYAATADAVRNGATRLDAYDLNGRLPRLYSQLGFVETERHAWNPEFADGKLGLYQDEAGNWVAPDYVIMQRGTPEAAAAIQAERAALGRRAPGEVAAPRGMAVPRPGYAAGTPEHEAEQLLRTMASEQGTATPNLTREQIRALPGMAGALLSDLDEVRAVIKKGLDGMRWYQDIVQQIRRDTGQSINPREAAVLMGRFGGNAGVGPNYHAMLTVFEAMRRVLPDLTGFETMSIKEVQQTQQFKDVAALVHEVGSYAKDDDLAGLMRGYRTGIVEIPSGAKLSSYTQSFLHALSDSYQPYSTQDVWQGRLFGARPGQGTRRAPVKADAAEAAVARLNEATVALGEANAQRLAAARQKAEQGGKPPPLSGPPGSLPRWAREVQGAGADPKDIKKWIKAQQEVDQLGLRGARDLGPDVAGSDAAYRSMHALTNWIARELDITPHEAQAAGWVVTRTLMTSPQYGKLIEEGRLSLRGALLLEERSGGKLLSGLADTIGEVTRVPPPGASPTSWDAKIDAARQLIRTNGAYDKAPHPSWIAAGDMSLRFPADPATSGGMRASDIPRPVGSPEAAELGALARADAPVLRVPGAVEVDPATGRIPWLLPEHSVQQAGGHSFVQTVGVGDEAARLIGQRLGADLITRGDPDVPGVGGLAIKGVEPGARAALTSALQARGVPVMEAGDALRVPLIEGEVRALNGIITESLAEAGVRGARVGAFTGATHAVGDLGRATESFGRTGDTAVAAGRPGVPRPVSYLSRALGEPDLARRLFRDAREAADSNARAPGLADAGALPQLASEAGARGAAAAADLDLPSRPPLGGRQVGSASPRFAADLGSAVAGGAAGYATTPEDASPLERGLRTVGGATLGVTGQRLATSPAARQRARQFMREEEGSLNLPDLGATRAAPTMGGGTVGVSQSPTFLREALRRMYPGAINRAAVKEAVQNSVDASRGIPGATTDVIVDNQAKTIAIVDQGKGMTPQVMEDVFVKLGGSQKPAGATGGMGTAIKAIMANAEDTWVRTMSRDPVTGERTDSIMHGSGDDFLGGTMHRYYAPYGELPESELRGAPPEIADLDYRSETGTAIWTKPLADVDWNDWHLKNWIERFNSGSRVPDQNVVFTVDGVTLKEGERLDWRGDPVPIDEADRPTQLLKTITVPGAEIDIYGTTAVAETDYMGVQLLNNGQYQADLSVRLPGNAKMPTGLVADVRATVDPKSVGYPWTADRNGLIDTTSKGLKDYIADDLAAELIGRENKRVADTINNAPDIGIVKLVDDAAIGSTSAADRLAEIPQERTYRRLATLVNDLHDGLIAELEGRDIPTPRGEGTIGPSHLVGLAVSKKWLGLNVPPSYTPWAASGDTAKGILIEPWQIWHEVENSWGGMTREEQMNRYIDGVVATMIHEIAHNTSIGGHEVGFAGLLTRVPQFLGSRKQQAITKAFRERLAPIWDTLVRDLENDSQQFRNVASESGLEQYGEESGAGVRASGAGRSGVNAGDVPLPDQGGRGAGRPPGGADVRAGGPTEGRPPQALGEGLPERPPLGGSRRAIEGVAATRAPIGREPGPAPPMSMRAPELPPYATDRPSGVPDTDPLRFAAVEGAPQEVVERATRALRARGDDELADAIEGWKAPIRLNDISMELDAYGYAPAERDAILRQATAADESPPRPPLGGRQAGTASARFAADVGSATAGGAAGYATTPEDASPLERGARTVAGATLATAGQRLATNPAARRRAREFMSEEEGALNLPDFAPRSGAAEAAEEARRVGRPPPAPRTPEYQDWLRGEGDWAPPRAEEATRAATGPPPQGTLPGEPDRTFDLDELAQMRAEEARTKQAPPPPPPPGSKDYKDWQRGRGKWEQRPDEAMSKVDQAVGYSTASMLSGIGGAVQNLVGGVQQNLYRPIELAVAARPTDAARDVMAMLMGVGEHFSRYGRTFKTGERMITDPTARQEARGLPGGLKNPANWILRNLAATDEFNGSAAVVGAQASEMSRLMRMPENRGKSFDEVLEANREHLARVGAEARGDVTFSRGSGPIANAGEWLATQRSKLLNSSKKSDVVLGVMLQIVAPMTRVPGVILEKGVGSLPVASEVRGAVNITKALRRGDHAAVRREIARMALTETTNMAILNHVLQGNITGDGPRNPEDRKRLEEAVDENGNALWRPNSIRIGNNWFAHGLLGPMSVRMGSIANLVDETNDWVQKPPEKRGDIGELISSLGGRELGTISNLYYLRGTADVLGAVSRGSLEGAAKELLTSGDRLVPGIVSETRQIVDPYARQPSDDLIRGQADRILNRIPGLSQTLPPQLGATTGEPVERPRDVLTTLLRGTPGGRMTPNPVAAEASRLTEGGNRVSIPREDEMYKGARQTPGQTRTIQQEVGRAINLYVLDTISKPAYDRLSEAQKADALNAAVAQGREAANITLGGQVARSPHESALMQWAQTPQYYGINSKLPPEEIARKNWEIAQAKAKWAAYRKEFGEAGDARLRRDDPQAMRLAETSEKIEKEELDARKRKIDKATGGALTEAEKSAAAGGLVGVGSTTLPSSPPRR